MELIEQPIVRSDRTADEVGLVPEIAFVIPAFNEERFIGATLDSIHAVLRGRCHYEIVVVDNGSSDRTPDIARTRGAHVYVVPGVTVASLRNYGAAHCSARVVVFVDADVAITDDWGASLKATLDALSASPRLVTGSVCGVPDNPSWLERNWFAPWQNNRSSHINSGHLVIGRAFFEELGGFDPDLQTGEDYEFSVRASKAGGSLELNPSLAVIHYGYPTTIAAFVKREMWHGAGDARSVGSVLKSAIALAAIMFVLLHMIVIAAITLSSAVTAAVAASMIVLMCVAASVRQYRNEPVWVILSNSAIYYFYFIGRALALARATSARTSFVPREQR